MDGIGGARGEHAGMGLWSLGSAAQCKSCFCFPAPGSAAQPSTRWSWTRLPMPLWCSPPRLWHARREAASGQQPDDARLALWAVLDALAPFTSQLQAAQGPLMQFSGRQQAECAHAIAFPLGSPCHELSQALPTHPAGSSAAAFPSPRCQSRWFLASIPGRSSTCQQAPSNARPPPPYDAPWCCSTPA